MKIVVTDAAGRRLAGALVEIDQGGPAPVDAQGELAVPDPTVPTTYGASHPLLHPISVQVLPGAEWTWDDPGSTLSPGPPATLTIPLSAVAVAPTERRDDREFVYDPRRPVPRRPKGILLDAAGRYRGLYDGHYSFHVAGPNLLGDAEANGWKRLDDRLVERVDPSQRGQFAFLEWGGLDGSTRLLVAAWAPWPPGPALRPKSDAVVYFTPTTSTDAGYPADSPPYRGEYPYGLTEDNGYWGQPYAGLAQRHLFNEKLLAYQLIAAGKRAPLICPIQPAANWQAFATQPGLGRLVREVILWFHRLQAPLPSYPQRSMPPDPKPPRRAAPWQPPPALRSLYCAGFSAGVGALIDLMEKERLPQGFPDPVFGSNPREMLRAWHELWDFDGPRNLIGSTAAWEGRLDTWCKVRRRAVGLYHSDYTGWSIADVESLNKLMPTGKQLKRSAKNRAAIHRTHITRGSAAAFNTPYLFNGPPGPGWQSKPLPHRAQDVPEFWEVRRSSEGAAVHQMIPMFAFGHAAGMSTLPDLP